MGDPEHAAAAILREPMKAFANERTALPVQPFQWFIGQNESRLPKEDYQKHHPLPLALGKDAYSMVKQFRRQTKFLTPLFNRGSRYVVQDPQPGKDLGTVKSTGKGLCSGWNGSVIRPISGVRDTVAGSLPNTRTRPPVGESRPEISPSMVLFPEPFGPDKITTSQGRIARFTSPSRSTAWPG